MRESDIEVLPGKKMGDTSFLCLASLTGTGLAKLYVMRDGKVVFDYNYRNDTMLLRRTIFDSFVSKGWISPSPLHANYWFVTDAGRKATLDEAKARITSLADVVGFPCDVKGSYAYNMTFTALEALHLLDRAVLKKVDGVTLEPRGEMLLAGVDLLAPDTVVHGGHAPYKTFEQHWKSHYDPEGHAADVAAQEAAEAERREAQRISTEAYLAAAAVRLAAAQGLHKEREAKRVAVETLREEVVRLAKGCFLQTASYDDLMTTVERLLRAEDEAKADPEAVPLAA